MAAKLQTESLVFLPENFISQIMITLPPTMLGSVINMSLHY